MSTTTYKQPTKQLTRKKLFQDSANALVLVAALLLGHVFGIQIPPGVEGAVMLAVGGWAGYAAAERV
jgi:hypothetical protein